MLDQDVHHHSLGVVVVHDQCLLAHPGHLKDQPVEDLLPLLVK